MPTSRRPIDLGFIEYLRRSEETVVSAKEYMSEGFRVRTAQWISARLKGPERTFSIIAEAHLRLPKTNCVFSCTNPIEFFELILGHTL